MFNQVKVVLKSEHFILQHPDCLLFLKSESVKKTDDSPWTTRKDEAQIFERPKDVVMKARELNLSSCFVCRALEEVAEVTIADKEPW